MGVQYSRTSNPGIIDERRTLVARASVRGATQREIVKELELAGIVNPETGAAWSLATVNADLKAVRREWRAQFAESFNEHVTLMLAEIRELRRQGWQTGNWDLVLKCMDRECRLMGLDQPDKLTVDWRKEAAEAGVNDASEIFNELLAVAASRVIGADGSGGDA